MTTINKFLSLNIFFAVLIQFMALSARAQCASGYTSGNLTISSTCTISSNITITGDMILNSGANVTINPGVVVTVTGNVHTGWNVGTVSISGGTLNIGTYLQNDDRTTLDITGVNMTTGTYFLNDWRSNMSVTNSTINVGTYLHNENETTLDVNNSVIIVEGYVYNDYRASFNLLNGSDMNIKGNPTTGGYAFHNEDQTDFIVDNSNLTISGNVYNDYRANLEVNNGGSMMVDGDFYNENEATISLTEGSLQVTGDFTNDFKAGIDVNNGSQMLIEGNLTSDSKSTIDVAAGGAFCANGTSSNSSTITSEAGDTDCSDGCCGAMVTLPVELLSYEGSYMDGAAVLSWVTATEINNDYFTIERSNDGVIFYEVGKVDGNGNSDHEIDYVWEEELFYQGIVYYRLKQTDYDGQYEYLGVVAVKSKKAQEIMIYPNPVISGQVVTVKGTEGQTNYIIRDISNNVVSEGELAYQKEIATHNLKAGYYIITITTESNSVSKKLIVR